MSIHKKISLVICAASLLLAPLFSFSHEAHQEKMLFPLDASSLTLPHSAQSGNATVLPNEIGVDEKLGKKIDLTISFPDEHGKKVVLGEYIDRPTLILPVYYFCPETCGLMLGHLATALNSVPLAPGKDYKVLAVSIDYEDTPAIALQAKANYARLLTKEFPDASWKYLSGDKGMIERFAGSTGFRFKRTGKHLFAHPNTLLVIGRDGTIIRYLYGPTFLPFDIGMALTEAEKGTPSLSVRKLVSYCFSYEPEKKTYSFKAVQVLVLGVLFVMGIFLFILLKKKRSA